MKKFNRRILSIVLSLCMIIALLPVNPAIAADYDEVDITKNTYATVDEIPSTFSGMVYTYSNTGGNIQIDAGLYNVPNFDGFDALFRYNPDDVSVTTPTWTVLTMNETGDDVNRLYANLKYKAADVSTDIMTDGLKMILNGSTLRTVGDDYSPFTASNADLGIENSQFTGYTYFVFMVSTDNAYSDFFKNVTESKHFNTPEANEILPLYSLYFKVNDEKTVTPDTFGVYEWGNMPGFLAADGDKNSATGVAFVGFPEASYPVSFTVTDTDGEVEGATVTITEAAGGEEAKSYSGTTLSDGTVSISVPAGNYTYTVSKSNTHESKSSGESFTVPAANNEAISFEVVLTKQTVTYPVVWIYTDADTNEPLPGVYIAVEPDTARATYSGTTGDDGTATVYLPEGSFTYTASLDGYVNDSGSVSVVSGSGADPVTATLTEEVVPTYTYTITVTDADNVALSGATVTVYDADGNEAGSAVTDDNGVATIEDLKAGSYTYSVSRGIFYTGVKDAALTVSSTESENNTSVELTKSVDGEPTYTLTGTYDESNNQFKVKVDLAYMAAAGASFGMKYDSKRFTLVESATEYSSDITVFETDEDNQYAPMQTEEGYVTFGWTAEALASKVLDATEEAKHIVTYTFNVSDDWEEWMDDTTFQTMPWTETAVGAASKPAVNNDIWDETEQKYVGFALGGENYSDDAKVPIDMVFEYQDIEKHRLIFKVIKANSDPEAEEVVIPNATVTYYDESLGETTAIDITTDENGIAEFVVGTETKTYSYKVSAPGYWPYPAEDADPAYATTGAISESTTIEVELETKAYHDVLVSVENGSVTSGEMELEDATLDDNAAATETWPQHATEDANYYFAAIPAAGYEIVDTPTYTVGEGGEATPATLDAATNRWYVPGTDIKDNISISVKFAAGESITITADMNEGGTLTWGGVAQETIPAVKTFKANEATGELVFAANNTPDDDSDTDYVIYQVIIDGSEYPIDADIVSFNYDFGAAADDHTISVTFKEKEAPAPEEYTVSVLAGEHGKATVSYGDVVNEELMGDSSKDYYVTANGSFTAVITPVDDNTEDDVEYEIDSVYVNGVKATLDNADSHTVSLTGINEAQSIVATFKVKGTDVSLQYWINTEIIGMGEVIPFGNNLYYAYDKPTYTFDPNDYWKMGSVELITEDGKTETVEGAPTSYTFEEGLTQDVTIKVTFIEDAKTVSAVVYYAQNEATTLDETTKPEVVFTRTDGEPFVAKPSVEMLALTGEAYTNYSVELPNGTYTITVTKHGHLSYTITGFVVSLDDSNEIVEGAIKLLPGNTNTDDYITFFDVLRVVNGMARYGNGSADIDESGEVDSYDMNYAKSNYAEEAVNVNYTQHQERANAASN